MASVLSGGPYGFRTAPNTTNSSFVFANEQRLDFGTNIIVNGTNGTWYYAEYNGQEGWIIAYGVAIMNPSCIPPLASYNPQTGEVDYSNIFYDYPLGLPEPPWYTTNNWSTLPLEDKFNIWRTQGAIYLWDQSTNSIRDYICTSEADTRHNCTLLVYVAFYELFYRIYGPERPLMLSDILAITYELELAPANITLEGANVAKQALGTYYFYQVGSNYCVRRPDTCNSTTLEIPIEHFVYQYRYINNNGVEVTSDGFLPPLNAWYHLGIRIADWYFGTPTIDLTLITSWQNIPINLSRNRNSGGGRLQALLKPTDNSIPKYLELITMAQLTLSNPRPRFSNTIDLNEEITWANFSYPGPLAGNEDTDFWKSVTADIPNDDFKFCVLNQSFDDNDTPDDGVDDAWGLDAFAIVTYNGNPGFGTTPPWAGSPYSRSFGTYRSCLCSEAEVINGC